MAKYGQFKYNTQKYAWTIFYMAFEFVKALLVKTSITGKVSISGSFEKALNITTSFSR